MAASEGGTRLETDVAVVGAGPGGVTLAYLLAKSGVDVTLLERERDLDRSFRGYLFQPFVLRTFDEMGVLGDVLDLEHYTVAAPSLTVYDRTIAPFDFRSYDPPFDHAILMEQPPLLRLLIDRAAEYDGFEYRGATTVRELRTDGGAVVGLAATDRSAAEDIAIRAKVVVGADGRYSTVRTAAGIDPGRFESSLELIWFKLPATAVTGESLGRINDAGVLLYFGLGRGEAQVGYLVGKGEFDRLRGQGLAEFYERITGVDPTLDGVLQREVTDYSDCSLLQIEPGISDRWIDDGLLLIGDAAHIASPIGGQGNGLAIADAVVAHSVLLDALPRTAGQLPAESLRRYAQSRQPTVERIVRLQRRAERVISAFVRHRTRLPGALRPPLFRGLARVAVRSPLADRLQDRFAWGSWEPVDTEHFVD